MIWFDYFLIAWFALGALTTIAMVGKPRKPIEPMPAAISTCITAALIVGVLWSAGAR